jgi:hypothetical protein
VDLLAADGDHSYWSTAELTAGSGTIRRTTVSPGGSTLMIARSVVVGGLALDDQHLYYSDRSTQHVFATAK